MSDKPACRFGSKCYRKNPTHFVEYSHPKEENKTSSKRKIKNVRGGEKKKIKICDKDSGTKNETKRKGVKMKQGTLQFAKKCLDVEQPSSDKVEENAENITSEINNLEENQSVKTDEILIDQNLENKSKEEIIEMLFLVTMPKDFYSFFEFYQSIGGDEAFQCCDLNLVGPFDVLSDKVKSVTNLDNWLLHWRFYYDPPEFQTVLTSKSEFHIGYWRDDPKDLPVFLASNTADKDCVFKILSENLFGTVFHYLADFEKTCDPFKKIKINKLKTALCDWAEKNEFSLEKKSSDMALREKKVVSKTFHKAGIVVPVEEKTEIGYRPLIESDAKIKKTCDLIIKSDKNESLWENLQPLIRAADIANDECDFGNSLELGIDLFCMGSSVFHEIAEHLLTTAYSLLDRPVFEKIIKVHLKNRKKGKNLSVL